MLDDPLSLLSLGVWLMAAGMWPVGFLFGACSACCDDDECEECTHYRFGTNCSELLNEVNVDFGEYGTLTVDKFNCGTLTPEEGRDDCVRDSPNQDAFSASFDLFESSIADLPEPFLPACSQDEFNRPWLGEPIKFFAEAAVNTPAEIVAGCGTKQAQVIVRVSDTGLNDFRIIGVATVNTNNCTGGVIENVPVVFEIDEVADLADFPDCAAAYLAFFNNLGVTVTVDYKPCACNKCTHAANGCNPTATLLSYEVEDYGSNQIENPGPEPAESCFDNSVSFEIEQLPETSLPYFGEQCITPISLSPFFSEPDGCGCSACCFEVVFQAQFNFENDGFARFEAVAVLCFDGCDQTEATTAQITEWSVVDEQGPTAELLEFLSSLALSTALTVEPCDCGACCDEGCEDNVAEGGCENWAGVGTSCCDDPNPCEEE